MILAASSKILRILLIDDEVLMRSGMRLLLEKQEEFRVIAEASTCEQALTVAVQDRPDLALLSLVPQGEKSLDCLSQLTEIVPEMPVLVLSGSSDKDLHYQAISRGAVGVVQKSEGVEKLIKAIHKVSAGEVWIDGQIMARALHDLWHYRHSSTKDTVSPPVRTPVAELIDKIDQFGPHPPAEESIKIASLTEREREIIVLIGEGLHNQQIADRLFISVVTVRHHLSSIFAKLGVSDRLALAIYAFRYELAKLPVYKD